MAEDETDNVLKMIRGGKKDDGDYYPTFEEFKALIERKADREFEAAQLKVKAQKYALTCASLFLAAAIILLVSAILNFIKFFVELAT